MVMREKFGGRIYGRYGFTDAFNPNTGWTGPDVLGIDVGIVLLSAENLRSGNVWRWFMRNAEIPRAMHLAGLRQAVMRQRKHRGQRLRANAGSREERRSLILRASNRTDKSIDRINKMNRMKETTSIPVDPSRFLNLGNPVNPVYCRVRS
jgi:hypothetical protein